MKNSPVIPAEGDDEMSVVFDNKIFGSNFGSGTLAVLDAKPASARAPDRLAQSKTLRELESPFRICASFWSAAAFCRS
jgi:hypothetical protein